MKMSTFNCVVLTQIFIIRVNCIIVVSKMNATILVVKLSNVKNEEVT